MSRHPLDNCEAAKRLQAIVEEETRRRADKIVGMSEDESKIIDKIFENYPLDLDVSGIDFDPKTGKLHIFASVLVPIDVKSVELHLGVAHPGDQPCPECGGYH